MRPNSRETTSCQVCASPIFFAVTKAGERQALDVEPHAEGSVMAYRGVRHWLARTLPRPRSAAAGEQLGLDAVDDLVDDPREQPPHPLEQRYRVHAASCAGAPPVQGALFGDGRPEQARPVATRRASTPAAVPAPRRPSPLIYNVKPGASHNPRPAQDGDAQVFDWQTAAPRIAARRRAARPASGQ